MTPGFAALSLLTGFGAGLCGAVTGVASLVAYPALLALGLGPVAANVTATVANVFGGVGSSVGSRPELVGQGRRVAGLAVVSAAAGLAGAAALLVTPPGVFARIVPLLIACGALAILVVDRDGSGVAPARSDRPVLVAATVAIAGYAGYFGAAAGVLMLSALMAFTGESLPRATGAKNVTMGAANAAAAAAFALDGPVHWLVAVPLSVGFLAGGRLGPVLVRRMPVGPLRVLVAACGLALAVELALRAYR